jgi:putative transposase
VYYRRRPTPPGELELMAAMDRQYLTAPYFGSRRMQAWLQAQGRAVSRKRVRRLMRLMGLAAIYQRPRTSTASAAAPKHPYLLRGMAVTRPDQVWAADITYIPMARGFLYLVVVMDWHSRCVLAWRLSNTLDSAFCVDALEEALGRGTPDIVNTDQGAQFTSEAFTRVLTERGVQISHDGKGRFMDNIFVERLWRSLKYEEVYLKAYQQIPEARVGIGRWLWFYNEGRPHQALKYRTPVEVYRSGKATQEAGLSLNSPHHLSN